MTRWYWRLTIGIKGAITLYRGIYFWRLTLDASMKEARMLLPSCWHLTRSLQKQILQYEMKCKHNIITTMSPQPFLASTAVIEGCPKSCLGIRTGKTRSSAVS